MTLQVDIGVPVSTSTTDQVDYIRRAEELGFTGVGLGDNLSSRHDIFVTMAAAACRTERIALYPAVANPVARSPAVLANLMRSLAEHAPRRVKLVLGRGGRDLGEHGMKPATLAELREAAASVRRQLKELDAEEVPPVGVAASGPRTLELAGEAGDEVFLQIGPDPRARRQALEHVQAGAAARGRWMEDVPITDYVMVSLAEDRDAALQRALPWVQYMIGVGTFQLALDAHSLDREEVMSAGRLTGGWRSQWADLLVIAGDRNEVADRLAKMHADGVRRVCCMVPGDRMTHRNTLEEMGRYVLPALR